MRRSGSRILARPRWPSAQGRCSAWSAQTGPRAETCRDDHASCNCLPISYQYPKAGAPPQDSCKLLAYEVYGLLRSFLGVLPIQLPKSLGHQPGRGRRVGYARRLARTFGRAMLVPQPFRQFLAMSAGEVARLGFRQRIVTKHRVEPLMQIQRRPRLAHLNNAIASNASFSARFPDEVSCIAHLENAARTPDIHRERPERRQTPEPAGDGSSIQLLARSAAVSRLPLIVWFHAFYLLASARFGFPAVFLERYFGLHTDEVRELLGGFELCIGSIADLRPFDGSRPVQIDETLVRCRGTSGADDAVTILGMSDRERVLAWPVTDRMSATLIPIIVEHVPRCSEIYTDGWRAYRRLPQLGYEHRYVRHNKREWLSSSGANTFAIDAFWAYLKRMIRVGRGPVDRFQLSSCLAEATVRFSHRRDPATLLQRLLSL